MRFLKLRMMRNSFLCTEHGSKRGERGLWEQRRYFEPMEVPGISQGDRRDHMGGGHMGASQQVIWVPL